MKKIHIIGIVVIAVAIATIFTTLGTPVLQRQHRNRKVNSMLLVN